MRVFGSTLFSCVPFTTRFLNADPAMLTGALKPVAFALATARTTSAVTRPPSTLTPADSATPVSVAVLLAGSTVLVLDAVSTLALSCFFQAEDGIRAGHVTEFRRVLFR